LVVSGSLLPSVWHIIGVTVAFEVLEFTAARRSIPASMRPSFITISITISDTICGLVIIQ
jgi:hypothetical protein